LSDADSATVATAVVQIRDLSTRIEKVRVDEKEPYLRSGQAVDQFFKSFQDKLAKTVSILHARVHAYNAAKLETERRLRAEAERAAREAAAKAEAERQEAERQRREAEAAAARARTEENRVKREQEAAEARAREEQARQQEQAAREAASDARMEAKAKSADIVRQRVDDAGRIITMRQVLHVEIVDRNKLDKEALWPVLRDEDLDRAVRALVKARGPSFRMDGVLIEMRDDTSIR
jgi:hypothetical protein